MILYIAETEHFTTSWRQGLDSFPEILPEISVIKFLENRILFIVSGDNGYFRHLGLIPLPEASRTALIPYIIQAPVVYGTENIRTYSIFIKNITLFPNRIKDILHHILRPFIGQEDFGIGKQRRVGLRAEFVERIPVLYPYCC